MRAGGSVADFEGLDLILVDSPGLFFEHRIDREVFRFGPGGAASSSPGAASSVREFYSRSDVIIFTLRWEQLFFHLLTDYLRQFRRDLAGFLNLKAFILVNASSHSLVQEGAAIRPYDQVAEENQARLRHYFEKHVGDPELIAALRDGSRISLHFCDLLDVAKHLFHPGGEDAPGASRSVEIIREIRRHIFDQGLPQQKADELDLLAGQCRSQAAAYLEACRAREDEALEGVERRIAGLGAEVQELAAEAAALEQQFDSIVAEVKAMRTRLERVAVRDFGKGALDAPSAAFLLMERRLLDLELEEPPEAGTAREQLAAAYRAWREGALGPRRLAALPEALWRFEPPAESVDHEPAPLKRLYESACARVLAQFEKSARDLVNEPELVAALDEFGADDVAWPLGPPETLTPAPPLLGFPPRRGRVRFRPLRVFLALTPAGLWGSDGRREITAERELAILEEETEGFLEQVWDEPWRFRDCFEPERLKTRLLLVFEQRSASAAPNCCSRSPTSSATSSPKCTATPRRGAPSGSGSFASALMAVMGMITVALPPAPGWDNQEAFATVFNFVPATRHREPHRLLGRRIRELLRARENEDPHQGRHLWMRTIGSTVVGQLVDTFNPFHGQH
jgi:hypothetical protein